MKKRSYEPEFIDLGPEFYTEQEYRGCLYQLGRIGKYLGGNKATLKIIKQLNTYALTSILDIGCGGGSFTHELARHFTQAQVVGIDIAPSAINYAQSHYCLPNLSFELRAHAELSEPEKSYDIVTATLLCHHLPDILLIDFLKRCVRVARKAVIINDLHRHWLAYAGCSVIIPVFFNNRLVHTDSLLSIKKSFTRADWDNYLQQANILPEQYSITWHWPFRWIVRIDVP